MTKTKSHKINFVTQQRIRVFELGLVGKPQALPFFSFSGLLLLLCPLHLDLLKMTNLNHSRLGCGFKCLNTLNVTSYVNHVWSSYRWYHRTIILMKSQVSWLCIYTFASLQCKPAGPLKLGIIILFILYIRERLFGR